MTGAGPYALVTGASSGIGEAIAWQLAARGIHPIIHGRDLARMQKVAADIEAVHGFEQLVICADLSTEHGVQRLIQESANRPISILVNNAGHTCWGKFSVLDLRPQEELIHTQVNAVVALTHHLLPSLLKMDKAHILNVASTTIYQPIPTMAVYGATKAFIRYFSRALRHELRQTAVNVTTLIPGTTESRFMERARMQALEKVAAKFAMSSESVAKAGVKGMLAGKAEVIPGTLNWVSAKASKLLPTSLTIRMAAGIYEKARDVK